jgi:hypothetical protein
LYLVGRTLGFLIVSSVLAVMFAAAMLVIVGAGEAVVWGASLVLELALVVLVAQLFALSFRQVSGAALAALLFYGFARLLGTIQAIFTNSLSIDREAISTQFFAGVLTVLSWITPDLGRFTQGAWLVDASAGWSVLFPLALETLIYGGLLLSVALFDFYRRELL